MINLFVGCGPEIMEESWIRLKEKGVEGQVGRTYVQPTVNGRTVQPKHFGPLDILKKIEKIWAIGC